MATFTNRFCLAPRRGNILRVLGIVRISTEHQDIRSLADQKHLLQGRLASMYDGPIEWDFVESRGSGEIVDSAPILKATEKVESKQYDLIMAEDLGRICRRLYAFHFCEMAEDCETRVITINDSVDTGQGNWRTQAVFSSVHHETSNKDTSERIGRTLRSRFVKGQLMPRMRCGYLIPSGAKHVSEIQKDPVWIPIYEEWWDRLERGASLAEIADWLNALRLPLPNYIRGEQWTGIIVARITRNPILKGLMQWNQKKSKRVNKTGRRKCIKAPPSENLFLECPNLQFIAPERYDRLIRLLVEKNAWNSRSSNNGYDDRTGVPRSRTPWPAQHAICGICGWRYYRTTSKNMAMLQCSGCQKYNCWNAGTVNADKAAQKLFSAIVAKLQLMPEFDSVLLAEANAAWLAQSADRENFRIDLEAEIRDLTRKVTNLVLEIANHPNNEIMRSQIQEYQRQLDQKHDQLLNLKEQSREIDIPSLAQIRAEMESLLQEPDLADPELSRTLHRMIPRLEFFPVQLCDGGAIKLRATVTLHLDALIPDGVKCRVPESVTVHTFEVDLFDKPMHEKIRMDVVELKTQKWKERDIASHLQTHQATVQRAMSLHRRTLELGLTDPYIRLLEPPATNCKFRRHLHKRYSFKPKPTRQVA